MDHSSRHALYRLWQFVEEPRNVTLVQAFLVYAVGLIGGVLTLLYPPETPSVILGRFWITGVAVLMIIGGAVGIVTAIAGWWWVERPLGVGFLLTGLGIYMYATAEAHILGLDNRYLQFTWLTIAAGGLIIRYMRIRRANYDPVA